MLLTGKSSMSMTDCNVACTDSVICRSEDKLRGTNHIHFGEKFLNYVTLPVIPPKAETGLAETVKEVVGL